MRAMARELITFDELGPETVRFHEERAGVRAADLLADIVRARARIEDSKAASANRSMSLSDPTVHAQGPVKLREETRAWLMLQVLSAYRSGEDQGRKTYSLTAACAEAGVPYKTVEDWRETYPYFDEVLGAIQTEMIQAMREEAYRRAVVGREEPLVHQGVRTGDVVRKFSDNLLQFTLQGWDAKFRQKDVNVSMSGSLDTNVNIEGIRDRLKERLRAKAKATAGK